MRLTELFEGKKPETRAEKDARRAAKNAGWEQMKADLNAKKKEAYKARFDGKPIKVKLKVMLQGQDWNNDGVRKSEMREFTIDNTEAMHSKIQGLILTDMSKLKGHAGTKASYAIQNDNAKFGTGSLPKYLFDLPAKTRRKSDVEPEDLRRSAYDAPMVAEAVKNIEYSLAIPDELEDIGIHYLEQLADDFFEDSELGPNDVKLSKSGGVFKVSMPTHTQVDNTFSKEINEEFAAYVPQWLEKESNRLIDRIFGVVSRVARVHGVRNITRGAISSVFLGGGMPSDHVISFLEEWCGYNSHATKYQESEMFWNDVGIDEENYSLLAAASQ